MRESRHAPPRCDAGGRMVSEYYGPAPNRRLQPPGFFALNYGTRTPAVTIAAHVIYGAIIRAFYELASSASTAAGYPSIAVAIGIGG